jgi:HEAT repeat protein
VPVALVELTYDPEGLVRAGALFTLAEGAVDGPEVRRAMTARLTDENDEARLQAAAGLALLGDPSGLDAFAQIAATVATGTHAYWRVQAVQKVLAGRSSRVH